MREIVCANCGKSHFRRVGEINRAHRLGNPLYCSLKCAGAVRSKEAKGGVKWHQARFSPRPSAVRTACQECGREMWLPKSKIGIYKRCGTACNEVWRLSLLAKRDRSCETCGAAFRPRTTQLASGAGRYCCQACNPSDHLITPEALAKAQQAKRDAIAAGTVAYPKGEANKQWMGGRDAAVARRIASGKAAAGIRAYRKKNPHKIREFAQRRKGRKLGRLEYGSIPRIGALQKWKCAICRASVKGGYHVDHITPLARGGEHKARNVQLLCGSCNVRKSAKDPIAYMQQIGRLL